MPIKITHKMEAEVPTPSGSGRLNRDLVDLKAEMLHLPSGMVLEIEAGNGTSVRSTKMLVTKAANQLGSKWKHWSIGTTVYAKPAEPIRRRGRRPKIDPR
jgi:hypothetical protein